jgi:hypothetical protein
MQFVCGLATYIMVCVSVLCFTYSFGLSPTEIRTRSLLINENKLERKLRNSYSIFSRTALKLNSGAKRKGDGPALQPLSRHPRDAKTEGSVNRNDGGANIYPFGNAVKFGGRGEMLKLKTEGKRHNIKLSRGAFTVEAWIKPEGGQGTPVSVIGECR